MTSLEPKAVEAFLRALRDGTLDQESVARLFGADRRLIVYGSLVPGGTNHHELADVRGTWHAGSITGRLHEQGWGWALGYPCLEWDPEGDLIPAHLLDSDQLPSQWARLDEFEGDGYERILVPFVTSDGAWTVGQVYAGSRASEEARD